MAKYICSVLQRHNKMDELVKLAKPNEKRIVMSIHIPENEEINTMETISGYTKSKYGIGRKDLEIIYDNGVLNVIFTNNKAYVKASLHLVTEIRNTILEWSQNSNKDIHSTKLREIANELTSILEK